MPAPATTERDRPQEREQPEGTALYHQRTGAFIGIVAQRTISVPVQVRGVKCWADVSIDYLLEVAQKAP